jgi:hypothetical protein
MARFCKPKLGDGAMVALAGALVGGPIGLVAGGVVGYTAGPSIASSWGLRGHRHYRHAHYRRNPGRMTQLNKKEPSPLNRRGPESQVHI